MAGTITLYHYTTAEGKQGISEDRVIRKSKKPVGDGKDDARYGDGVYLTSLPPSMGKIQLALNNYDGSDRLARAKINKGFVNCYVKIGDIRKAAKEFQKIEDPRDIYMYPGDLFLTEDMDVTFGDVDKK